MNSPALASGTGRHSREVLREPGGTRCLSSEKAWLGKKPRLKSSHTFSVGRSIAHITPGMHCSLTAVQRPPQETHQPRRIDPYGHMCLYSMQ